MRTLILLSAILATSCAKTYVQPELPIPVTPPYESQYSITPEEEEELKAKVPHIYIKVVKQKHGYTERIKTLEEIIKSTH